MLHVAAGAKLARSYACRVHPVITHVGAASDPVGACGRGSKCGYSRGLQVAVMSGRAGDRSSGVDVSFAM